MLAVEPKDEGMSGFLKRTGMVLLAIGLCLAASFVYGLVKDASQGASEEEFKALRAKHVAPFVEAFSEYHELHNDRKGERIRVGTPTGGLGRMVVVEVNAQKAWLSNAHILLPPELRAGTPELVEVVVIVTRRMEHVGNYEGRGGQSEAAAQHEILTMTFFEEGEVTGWHKFFAPPPPSRITSWEDAVSRVGDEAIAAELTKIARGG